LACLLAHVYGSGAAHHVWRVRRFVDPDHAERPARMLDQTSCEGRYRIDVPAQEIAKVVLSVASPLRPPPADRPVVLDTQKHPSAEGVRKGCHCRAEPLLCWNLSFALDEPGLTLVDQTIDKFPIEGTERRPQDAPLGTHRDAGNSINLAPEPGGLRTSQNAA